MASDAPPRLACVSVHALALQLAERRRGGADAPIAVVDRSGPQGHVTMVGESARAAGIRPGLRASAALGLCPALTLCELDPAEIAAASESLLGELGRFSPRIEAASDPAGVFWIDPRGMSRLYGDPAAWAAALHQRLDALGWRAGAVVGFRRFLACALAEGLVGARVFADPAAELAAAAPLPLARLPLPGRRVQALAALEIHTLGDLLRLPAGELRPRFGPEVADLYAQARGLRWQPIAARPVAEAITATLVVDPPEEGAERLLFAIKGILPGLLDRLALGEKAAAIELSLSLDHADPISLRIAAAEPTVDLLQLVDLIRLRLSATALAAPIVEITLTVEASRPPAPQIDLMGGAARRDPRAAERALDRIRAAYGDEAVTRASLRPSHLPEAGFAWEPTRTAAPPRARAVAANLNEESSSLCRRILARPRPLNAASGDPALDEEGPPAPSLAAAGLPSCGVIRRLHGPHRVSGGWWVRSVERDYYYAETSGGDLLWLFYDRPRRRWFLHGLVD